MCCSSGQEPHLRDLAETAFRRTYAERDFEAVGQEQK